MQPDDPTIANPSDHKIAFVEPHTDASKPVPRETLCRIVRPLSDDNIAAFANWIQHEPWTFVYDGADASDMVSRFNYLIDLNLDKSCPAKTVKSTNLDGKIRSVAVAQACRRKKREYEKHGNSMKYKKLKKEARLILKSETRKLIAKQIDNSGSKNNTKCLWFSQLTARDTAYK